MTARFMTGLLLLLTLAAFLLSLMAGKVWIWPMSWAADNADGWIFLELRLPRALLGPVSYTHLTLPTKRIV